MTLAEALRNLAHNLTHRHALASKDGIGTFSFCTNVFRRCTVTFQPDLNGAGWHRVPRGEDSEGVLLVARMLRAASAHEAMALLRRELEEP